MVYKIIPLATDNLDDSQVDIKNNFEQLDTSFKVDHVALTDTTADNGRHKTVTFVSQASDPTTAAEQVKSFSLEHIAAIGPLQFSKAESDSVSTPVTSVYESAAFNLAVSAFASIIDFSGLTRCLFFVSSTADTGIYNLAYGVYDAGTLKINSLLAATGFNYSVSGTTLRVRNTTANILANVRWTINFLRVE